jgi:hypothetical protein
LNDILKCQSLFCFHRRDTYLHQNPLFVRFFFFLSTGLARRERLRDGRGKVDKRGD